MWKEIKRKLFHLGALIYVVGLIYMPRAQFLFTILSLLIATAAFETLRLKNEKFRLWFGARFGGLMRESENERFSGVFWMLLGVLITVLVARPVPIAAASMLYLILGDAIASLAGKRLGGPHWPNSERRISGSLACLVVCVFVGYVLLLPVYGWAAVIIGAVAATALESTSWGLNDNFTIPVFSCFALMITCGVRPF